MPEKRQTWQFHHVPDSLRNLEMEKRSKTNAFAFACATPDTLHERIIQNKSANIC